MLRTQQSEKNSTLQSRHTHNQTAPIENPAVGALTADHYEFDEQTVEQIRRLSIAKQRAVEMEDYDEAKKCKDMIDRLRRAGAALKQVLFTFLYKTFF